MPFILLCDDELIARLLIHTWTSQRARCFAATYRHMNSPKKN
jgi:hypothetical protein